MYALNEARQALAGVDLVEGLATPEIHARLKIGARLGDTGQGILAFYLHEMDRLELHAVTGHESAAKFAEDRLGLDRRRAAELVRVGERLASLPLVQVAFCEQRIGWTKLLLLVRRIEPELLRRGLVEITPRGRVAAPAPSGTSAPNVRQLDPPNERRAGAGAPRQRTRRGTSASAGTRRAP